MIKYKYQEKFPADYTCPPKDSTTTESVCLYRLGKYAQYNEKDFVPNRKYYDPNNPECCCKSSGLSVCISLEAIKKVKESLGVFSERFVYKAIESNNYGRVKHTPSNKYCDHHTLRPYFETDLSQIFKLIKK